MKKKRSSDSKSNTEVLILDSAYKPEPSDKQPGLREKLPAFPALFLSVIILFGSVVSAFAIKLPWFLAGLGIFLYSLFFFWFFLEKRLDGKRLFAVLFLIIIYGVVCFILQEQITGGYYGTADCVIRKINQIYGGNIRSFGTGTKNAQLCFWLCILFPITGILGGSLVKKQNWLPILAVLFPVAALTMAAGGKPGTLWLYLFVMMVLLLFAAGRSYLPGWKTAGTAVLLAIIISVPAWYMAKPFLAAPAAALTKTTTRLQNHFLQSLWQLLPKISGGNLKLSLEGVGGGVEDGKLGQIDGYYFTGVDALKVTSTQKPQETVYLKGFIGEEYTGSNFESGNEENFQNAAASWRTEGNSSVYIQNLPFLRMMYYENYAADDKEGTEETADVSGELQTTAATIKVENLNANTQYTYVPYNAFLNDNYQISGGDASVMGQTLQEDIFSCYWRSDYKELMEACRDKENTDGMLNDLEASYHSFCTTYDLAVPEDGLSRLKEECKKKKEEEHWGQSEIDVDRPDWDVADEYQKISQYVIKRLLSECTYQLDADKLPEGQDFVETFLYDTKEGYSMHFAAAATMMFRMFGVPARYVVGYVAPKEIFTANENGTYTAVLEDDNAHAWVEIYEPFLGWTPVEVTPGMEGKVAEKEEKPQEGAAPSADKKEEKAKEKTPAVKTRLFSWFTGNLESIMLVVQIVLALAAVIFLINKIRKMRRERYGIGEEPAGQLRALYRTFYGRLVKKGMPQECTLADESMAEYLRTRYPALAEEDINRLQMLVLNASYGFGEITEEDIRWVRKIMHLIG